MNWGLLTRHAVQQVGKRPGGMGQAGFQIVPGWRCAAEMLWVGAVSKQKLKLHLRARHWPVCWEFLALLLSQERGWLFSERPGEQSGPSTVSGMDTCRFCGWETPGSASLPRQWSGWGCATCHIWEGLIFALTAAEIRDYLPLSNNLICHVIHSVFLSIPHIEELSKILPEEGK